MATVDTQNLKGYELRERIGAGGFGAVYRAYQSTIGREVAIKIILPGLANQPEFIRRFEGEAQFVARLEHPHITPLYDYWRDPEGAYLVMRWLRGGSLRETLQNGPFELHAALLLLDQIAGALSLAHRNNVIHRDIKPGNILLDEDGNAYLTDFGIAKDLKFGDHHTQADEIVGSLDYISPEQARSEPITPRTDIYSLGVTLYEVITGKHPFENVSPVEKLYKHINEPLPAITTLESALSTEVNRVIQKATAKNPEHRYEEILAFAADFREAIGLNRSSTSIIELLTLREQEILQLIIEGLSNKEIAQRLTVTVGTVKWYIKQIYDKLGVRSRVQAMVRARELHLLTKPGQASPIHSPAQYLELENPYKGLRAFQSADHLDFFGREKVTTKLLKRLGEKGEYTRFLSVIGPSGSGKSSLVKAGLIPALWRGDLPGSEKWFIVEMLPGPRPLDELEIALTKIAANQAGNLHEHLQRDQYGLLRAANLILPNDSSDLVLIIDQFEEVFTLVENETVRTCFLELLYAAVTEPRSRVRVVITLRADFYDRPLNYTRFGELIRSRLETILPLSAEEWEHAIAGPADRTGAKFEPGLVSTIVADVNYQPGALPLLQYALTELFERREGNLLTREAYQLIGGTVGALAKRADELYLSFDETGKNVVRQLFLRLVTLGEGTGDTRRRTARAELLAISTDTDLMDEIIDTYAEYRLLSLDNDPGTRSPTVEVAHEAILHEWERLRGWLNDNRDQIRLQRQLASAADEWQKAKQDVSFLLRGTRLETFGAWAQNTELALTPVEHEFLNSSLAQHKLEIQGEVERQAHEKHLEKRAGRFLQGLVAVMAIALLGAIVLTGAAVNSANEAQAERQRAEQQTRIAQSRELVGYADKTLASDAELSTLLALEAINKTYETDGIVLPEAESILHRSVQAIRAPARMPIGSFPSGWVINAGFSPDGSRLYYPLEVTGTYQVSGTTGIADGLTRQFLYSLPGDIISSQSSTNNQLVIYVVLDDTYQLQLWDTSGRESGQLVATVSTSFERWQIEDVSIDLRHLVTLSSDNRTHIWDLITGEEIISPAINNIPSNEGRRYFNQNGTLLGVDTGLGEIIVLDTAHWEEIARLSNPAVYGFGFGGPNNHTIGTLNLDGSATAWDAIQGEPLYTISPDVKPETGAMSNDGTRVVLGKFNGQLTIWDTDPLEPILNLSTGEIAGLFFTPDSAQLVTIHNEGYFQFWDLIPGKELLTMVNSDANDGGALSLAYSPDGTRLLTASVHSSAFVWDAITGQKLLTLSGHAARVLSVTWSPDGNLLATGAEDGSIKLWDAVSGEEVLALSGHSDEVYALAFSPDGSRLATSSHDQKVHIWDVTAGGLILTLEQPAWSKGVAWSPDGLRIAAGTDIADDGNGHVRVWDAATGKQQLDIPVGKVRTGTVTFSPDGSRILAGTQVNYAYVWDAVTGEQLLKFASQRNNVPGVAYNADGTHIATAGQDGTIHLWDASTGQELLTLYGPAEGIARVAFSPDGKHLATQNADGTTRVYILDIKDLIVLAKSRLTRSWTEAECKQYLHTAICPDEG